MSEISLKAYAAQSGARKYSATPTESRQEEVEYEAFTFGKVGRKAEVMLDMVRADGYHLAISYIDIKEIDSSDPANGFTLYTPRRKIIIEGTNLGKCYSYLRQNRVAELRQADRPAAMAAGNDEAVIHQLLIK